MPVAAAREHFRSGGRLAARRGVTFGWCRSAPSAGAQITAAYAGAQMKAAYAGAHMTAAFAGAQKTAAYAGAQMTVAYAGAETLTLAVSPKVAAVRQPRTTSPSTPAARWGTPWGRQRWVVHCSSRVRHLFLEYGTEIGQRGHSSGSLRR